MTDLREGVRKLAACPFCGSSAIADYANKAVSCSNPSCDAAQLAFGIDNWNRRALLDTAEDRRGVR